MVQSAEATARPSLVAQRRPQRVACFITARHRHCLRCDLHTVAAAYERVLRRFKAFDAPFWVVGGRLDDRRLVFEILRFSTGRADDHSRAHTEKSRCCASDRPAQGDEEFGLQ